MTEGFEHCSHHDRNGFADSFLYSSGSFSRCHVLCQENLGAPGWTAGGPNATASNARSTRSTRSAGPDCATVFKAFFRWWKADQNPGAHGAHLSTSVSKATWLSLKSWTSFARYNHNNHSSARDMILMQGYVAHWFRSCRTLSACEVTLQGTPVSAWIWRDDTSEFEICRWSSESPEVERQQRSKGMVDWRLWWLFLQLGLQIQVGLSVSKQTLCLDLFGSIIIRIYSMHVKQAPPGPTPLIYDIHRFTLRF